MGSDSLLDYLFILNPSKCGSTWLAKTLSVRPHLLNPGEMDFLFFLEFPLEMQWNRATTDDPEFLAVREDLSASPLEKLEELYRLKKARHPDVRMLIDKSPSNVLVFPRYFHLFRSSRIIVLQRDPRDVFVSMEFFYQGVLKNKPVHRDLDDPDYLLHRSSLWYAIKTARATLECERLLNRSRIPFLRISYEELVADFGRVARRVLEYTGLGLEEDTSVLPRDQKVTVPLGDHLARAQTAKPLFRKGVVGNWRQHLRSEATKNVVKELGGDLLVELGYEPDGAW